MANERLAQTYAQAIFETAVADWLTPLKNIAATLAKDGLAQKLDDPTLGFAQKQELLRAITPAGASTATQNFVALLASKNEIHLLPQVVAEFERYAQRETFGARAQITSAVPLTDAEKQTLEAKLRAQFGESIAFEYATDASILGGVVVRVGDKVIDGSVAGKLAALKEKLKV